MAAEQVASVTGVDLAVAATLLSQSHGDVAQAIALHFDGQGAAGAGAETSNRTSASTIIWLF